MFGDFPIVFLILISSVISLLLVKMFNDFDSFKFVEDEFIVKDFIVHHTICPWALKKNICSVLGGEVSDKC